MVDREKIARLASALDHPDEVLALAARRLESFLFQVTVLDPLPVLAVAVIVLFLAWRAAAGPARVAARQDPMQALRSD